MQTITEGQSFVVHLVVVDSRRFYFARIAVAIKTEQAPIKGLDEVGYFLLFSFFVRIQKTKIFVVIVPSAITTRFHTPFSFPFLTFFFHLQLEL